MSKISVKSMLNNKTENKFYSCETNAIIDNNKIKYLDDDVMVIIEINDDDIIINRKSKEYDITLPFKKDSTLIGAYNVKELGTLDLKVKTNNIERDNNKLKIEYLMILDNISKSEFEFIIDFIEGE